MAIVSGGIGSGLDVNGLVSQLMALERRPLNLLEARKQGYNNQLSAFGKIKSDLDAFRSAMSALKNTGTFDVFKTSTSDEKILTTTATASASAGPHTINVQSLAKAQIQVAATGYSDTTSGIGLSGDLSFAFGTSNFTVNIAATDSLTAIQNSINAATGNTGVTASILNDGTANGNRLVLTAKNSGTSNTVTVGGSLAAGLAFNETSPATNAVIDVDGVLNITKQSNTITDVVPGVTLELKGQGAATINVTRNNDAIAEKVTAFVDAYNKLATTIGDLRKKGAILEADGSSRSVLTDLQGEFNTAVAVAGGAYSYLAQVGVTFGKDGKLSLNKTELGAAIDKNLSGVVSLFADQTQGFATRLYNRANAMLQSDGTIDAREDGLNDRIRNTNNTLDQVKVRLENVEKRLRAQFAALDSLVGSLQQTSSFLTSQLR